MLGSHNGPAAHFRMVLSYSTTSLMVVEGLEKTVKKVRALWRDVRPEKLMD